MAKKFTFRLDPVLNLKTHKVSEQKENLNRVVKQRSQKEMQIDKNREYHSSLLKDGAKSAKASELQARYHHKSFVEGEIRRLENERCDLIEIENLRRGKLTEAMKEEKVLMKLKEKQFERHQEEEKKEETKTMDEIARYRHDKNSDKLM